MVTSGARSDASVRTKSRAASDGRMRVMTTDTRAASRMTVPVAESQLSANTAGTAFPVSGWTTPRWTSGNGNDTVAWSRSPLTGLMPQLPTRIVTVSYTHLTLPTNREV